MDNLIREKLPESYSLVSPREVLGTQHDFCMLHTLHGYSLDYRAEMMCSSPNNCPLCKEAIRNFCNYYPFFASNMSITRQVGILSN